MRTPWSIQKRRRSSARPTAPASLGLEVERIDVLVLLGRVLRVLNGAVGPPAEPLGVLAYVGMIGRALEGDVESDLEPCSRARATRPAEIVERAELRMDRLVAAFAPSRWPTDCRDRPAAAASALLRPLRWSGRWDGSAAGTARRSPCRRHRQARLAIANVPWRPASGCTERGNNSYQALNRARTRSTVTRELDRVSGGKTAIGIARGERGEGIVLRRRAASAPHRASVRRRCAQLSRRCASSPVARAAAAATRSAPARAAMRDVLGIDATREVVSPRQESGRPTRSRCNGRCRCASTVNSPRQRSFPSARIGVSCHACSSSRRYSKRHASCSCPSAKQSASTRPGRRRCASPRSARHRRRAITASMTARTRPSVEIGARLAAFFIAVLLAAAGLSSGRRAAASVRLREWRVPCAGTGAATTPPKLPMPLPP